jgi:hypothetical protein
LKEIDEEADARRFQVERARKLGEKESGEEEPHQHTSFPFLVIL